MSSTPDNPGLCNPLTRLSTDPLGDLSLKAETPTPSRLSVPDRSQPTTPTAPLGKRVVVEQVQCHHPHPQLKGKTCRARLFDARAAWVHVPATHATIIIQCWRCRKINLLKPREDVFPDEE